MTKRKGKSLVTALKGCKGKRGCEFAACLKKAFGKAPKRMAKKCHI